MNHKDFTNLDIDSMSHEELVSLVKALIAYINTLEQKIEALERAKNNNSKNSSLPPSTDQKPEASAQSQPVEQGKTGKAANTYNQRQKTGRRPGGQKGRKGKTLTKEQAEELLKNEDVIHQGYSSAIPISSKSCSDNTLLMEPFLAGSYSPLWIHQPHAF